MKHIKEVKTQAQTYCSIKNYILLMEPNCYKFWSDAKIVPYEGGF